MIENNTFNPELDLGTVIVGLNVDINNMIESHSIPATAADVVYNDIDNIEDVGERIDIVTANHFRREKTAKRRKRGK